MESNKKWYILNVMAGQENKIATEIKSMITRKVLGSEISEVLVPTKPTIKIKKGQKVQELQKIFPGYIFINADLGGEIYNLLNSIPKTMGFLGSKNNPQPISEDKMQDIIKLSSNNESDNKNLAFEIGETLNIIEGPFESFSGVVEEYDIEKQKIKISVSIFGRATSVELAVDQVEKVL
jgi:transcription termination/antitermination protein NusG